MPGRLLLVAVQLLTRLPVGDPMDDPRDLARSVGWFSVVGALVGGLSAFVWWTAALSLPSAAAATLAVLVTVMATGALHEDGLADTADGLFGGNDPESRLRIMGDPTVGSFGTIAIVLVVLLKVTLLAALPPDVGAAALVVSSSLGRGFAAISLLGTVPARSGGSGALLLDHLGVTPPLVAGVTAVIGTSLLAGLGTPVVVAAAAAAAMAVRSSAVRRLGGLTGDVMGAMILLAEVASLATLVALEVGAGV